MRWFLIWLLFLGIISAQSIAITAPSSGTVSGSTAITVTCTSCPTLARVEYRINGQRLWGEGTAMGAYSETSPYSYAYNFSYLCDGTHQLTALAEDAFGNILATSSPVNVIVNSTLLATTAGQGLTLSSPNPAVSQSGTITISTPTNITASNNPAISSLVVSGFYSCYWDGALINQGYTSFGTVSFSFDTTTTENGIHDLNCSVNSVDGSFNRSNQPVASIERAITTGNGSSPRELRLNYQTVYLWLSGTTTATLSSRLEHCDNTETTPGGTTYTSNATGVATVGSSTGVVTAVAAGNATITATNGSYTTTARIVVQVGTPIAPHFGYDGSLQTSYNPAKSIFVRDWFQSGQSFGLGSDVPPQLAANGANVFENYVYDNPYDMIPIYSGYPTLTQWETVENAGIVSNVNTWLTLSGFRSFWGICSQMMDQGSHLQSSADGGMASRMAYIAAQLPGKIVGCDASDESTIPAPRPGNNGVIGGANGPSQAVVSGGSGATVLSWPAWQYLSSYGGDIVSATNACLDKNDISLGTAGSISYTSACANGTYKPSGGTTETGLQVLVFNELCGTLGYNPPGPCQNFGPLNIQIPNSIVTDIETAMLGTSSPLQLAIPLQGSANSYEYSQVNGTVDGVRVAGFGDVYYDFDGPESVENAFPTQEATRQFLLSMENHFWNNAQPGLDLTRPFVQLIHPNGQVFQVGGASYTLGTTSGAVFHTTAANNAIQNGKITVTGSSCNGTYDIASVQSSTQFTVSQSPGCSGSGGTVLISQALGYYDPPYDVAESAGGARGVAAIAQMWDAVSLGASGERLFAYDSAPQQRLQYPATFASMFACNAIGPCPQGDSGQTTIGYVNNTPPQPDLWNAVNIAFHTIGRFEPLILQPECNSPGLGVRVHAGCKTGSNGTIIIAVNDFEVPNTINFTFGTYFSGATNITRYRLVNGVVILSTLLAGSSTNDTFVAQPGETDLWVGSPTANIYTVQANLPGGSTQAVLRFSTISTNIQQQDGSTGVTCTSTCTITADPTVGTVYGQFTYLNSSNVVQSTSSVRALMLTSITIPSPLGVLFARRNF